MSVLTENQWNDTLTVTQVGENLVRFGEFIGDISKLTKGQDHPMFFSSHRPPNLMKSSLAWLD